MTGNITKKVFLVLVTTLVSLGVAFPAVQAGDGVMFGYKFETGKTLDYKVKFTQEVDFGGYAFSQFADFEVTEKCTGVNDDGKFAMEVMFNKAASSRMQFDKMAEDKAVEALVGQSVSFLVDAHGDVSEIKPVGYIENWEQMGESIESVLGMWYAYLPGEEVAAGDGWENSKDMEEDESGMKISTSSEFTFKEKKKEKGRECAVITAKVKQVIEGTNATPMGNFDADGTGKGNFEILFDPAGSVIVKLKSKFEIKMDMTPESGKGENVETTVNVSMERELL